MLLQGSEDCDAAYTESVTALQFECDELTAEHGCSGFRWQCLRNGEDEVSASTSVLCKSATGLLAAGPIRRIRLNQVGAMLLEVMRARLAVTLEARS